jgi:hypothetical protein
MTLEQISEYQGFTLDGYYYQINSIDEKDEMVSAICTDNQAGYEFSLSELNEISSLKFD